MLLIRAMVVSRKQEESGYRLCSVCNERTRYTSVIYGDTCDNRRCPDFKGTYSQARINRLKAWRRERLQAEKAEKEKEQKSGS